jgi:hypothetical protein
VEDRIHCLKRRKARAFNARRFLLLAGFLLTLSVQSRAEVFESTFLKFRLPDGWKCKFEEDVFTCQPPLPKGQKHSMLIIVTAKYQGEGDTLPDYMIHLRTPGTIDGPKINNSIGKVAWVEATLLDSELKGYYTKYLTTVWDGVAILVTFSVHKDSYPRFQSLIAPCIQSMELKSDWKKK